MNKRYKFFKWLKSFAEKGMKQNYLKPYGGCDSCCPKCKEWESTGNTIVTTPLNDGSDKRKCEKCGHEWIAIFTPVGFVPLSKDDAK